MVTARPSAALRRGRVAATLGLAAVIALGISGVEQTSAAYHDEAAAAVTTHTKLATHRAADTWFSATGAAVTDGFVWVWGYKGYGMSGNGAADVADPSPRPVAGLRDVVKVVGASDAGETHGTFGALTASGEVYTWGSNRLGRLGIGVTSGIQDFRSTPQHVIFPTEEHVVDLGSMRGTMVALTANGRIYTWGSGRHGQAANGSIEAAGPLSPQLIMGNVHSVHVGQRITWVITRENRVAWWGQSTSGEYGGGTAGLREQPRAEYVPPLGKLTRGCEGPPTIANDPGDTCSIRQITSTSQTSALLSSDGKIYTFGHSAKGQLGRTATVAGALEPQPIPSTTRFAGVSAGATHFTAFGTDGSLWGWGDNARWQATGNIRQNGATGQGTTEARAPFKLPLSGITGVGGSLDASYATRSDSVLFGWGDPAGGAIVGASGAPVSFTTLELPGAKLKATQ